jgi:tetraacyldisaccharide 4'-kinase
VSVGNLSMGGRGKTPLVAHLARLLIDAGERPAILSRGYGRRRIEDGVVVVSDGQHLLADLDRSGDEPLMLARTVPGAGVFVCEQRVLAGALAERRFGATVHVLDDGFQHLTLARDVDVVIVAPEDLTDKALPFGRLREPPGALASAHAVVIDAAANAPPMMLDLPATVRQFSLRRALGEVRGLEAERPWPREREPVVAAAGIARPERFATALREAGWTVARDVGFADHHRYTAADVARLVAEVRAANAIGVLTTEKDAERLRPWRPFPVAIAAVPLEVTVEGMGVWLVNRVREARA